MVDLGKSNKIFLQQGTEPTSKRLKTEDTTTKTSPSLTTPLGRFSNVVALGVEEGLSLEDFLECYKKTGQPVVIRGAIEHWPACEAGGHHQWSTKYLKKVGSVCVRASKRFIWVKGYEFLGKVPSSLSKIRPMMARRSLKMSF